MDIMDFLEESSTERMVLELRFIDCKPWAAIERELNLSRSSTFSVPERRAGKIIAV